MIYEYIRNEVSVRLYTASTILLESGRGSFRKRNRHTLKGVALIDKLLQEADLRPILLIPRKSMDQFLVKVVKWHGGIGGHAL